MTRPSSEEWLSEEYVGVEATGVELIRSHWGLVLRRFRWDTAVHGERTTVRITVCAWCDRLDQTIALRDNLALRDHPYIVSHGMCDECANRLAVEDEQPGEARGEQ